jgi:tetratricopeptide (TPR) repeat protein
MALTKLVAPSETIFTAMSPHLNHHVHHHHHPQQQQQSTLLQPSMPPNGRNTTISSSSIPMLSMMIDRSSFDETDDFGVDQVAKTKASEACIPAPPVIMKDGKVRRRLRWRPKGMQKRRKVPPPPPPLPPQKASSSGGATSATSLIPSNLVSSFKIGKNHSSSGSVVSQTSRQSKKSLHSFASTETACVNNKTAARMKYPSSNLISPQPKQSLGSVATIGNEGDHIQARIYRSRFQQQTRDHQRDERVNANATIFAAADTVQNAPRQQQHHSTRDITDGVGKSKGEINYMSNGNRKQGGTGLKPPLFQRPGAVNAPRNGPHSKRILDSTEASTSTGSLSDSHTSLDVSLDSGSSTTTDGSSVRTSALVPVPVLSGDDVERERLVDLRIRKSSSFTSLSSHRSNENIKRMQKNILGVAKLEDGVEPLSIHELRFDEERQDLIQLPNKPQVKDSGRGNTKTDSQHNLSLNVSSSSSFGTQPEDLDEIRFPMTDLAKKQSSPTSTTLNRRNGNSNNQIMSQGKDTKMDSKVSPQKVHTCPVDVDKGTFLEAEKNLQAIHEMASEHLRQGEHAEALEVFEEILRGQLARFGQDHYRVGTALHNIGIVHMRRKDYVRALTVYKEAVRIRKGTLDPLHPDVAASLAQLGVAYMERDKHRKAIGAFREALKIRRKCLGNDHPKVAKILNNIGCSLFELNELEVAMVAFEEALDIQRNLLRHPIDTCPVTESSLLSIASTQCNIASIKLYCGYFDEALVDLEEALLVQQCALGDDSPLARRTQESIRWVEKSRQKKESAPVSVDLVTQLTEDSMPSTVASSTVTPANKNRTKKTTTATTSTANNNSSSKRSIMSSSNMFDTLLARLDLACGGWDPIEDVDENRSYFSGETVSDRSFSA